MYPGVSTTSEIVKPVRIINSVNSVKVVRDQELSGAFRSINGPFQQEMSDYLTS